MKWKTGQAEIAGLISDGKMEVVLPDLRVAQQLLEDARHHLASATTIRQTDLTGSYQLAYDALRKSVAAILQVQGLRPTSHGGHIAVQCAIRAQFPSVEEFKPFNRIRQVRHSYEYLDSATEGPTVDDVDDVITSATAALNWSTKLLASGELSPWSP
ncbi:MAG: hypothetical protein AAB018_01685 [Actinomycetota bacterium]